MLTFDRARHAYALNGRAIPSVTQVLEPLYDFASIPRETLERKRQIGSAVDFAITLDLENDLDEGSIAPEVEGYIAGWRKYRADRQYQHVAAQRKVCHPTYGVAGTLDLFGMTLRERKRESYELVHAVIDVKATFDMHPAVRLQTAAYQTMLGLEVPAAAEACRMGLQLKPDGTYEEHWFDDPRDWAVFLAYLTTRNWAALNGLVKRKAA